MRHERQRVINIPKHVFQNCEWARKTYNGLSSNDAHQKKVEQPQIPFSYPRPTKPVADWNNEKANSDKCCDTEMDEE